MLVISALIRWWSSARVADREHAAKRLEGPTGSEWRLDAAKPGWPSAPASVPLILL